jgi:glycosyltransferase involved in cell wall biosynthesis
MIVTNIKKQKYRILFCSPALTFGGEQKQMVQLLQNLDRERFEIIVCSIRPFGYLDEAIKQSGVPIICLGRPNPYDLRSILDLRQVIKKNNIDLVQVGIFGSEFHGLLAAIITGTPTVAILQSSYDLSARAQASKSDNFALRGKWRILYAVHGVLSRIAKVNYVALSEVVKQSAINELHLLSKLVKVIPLGVAPEEFDRDKFSEQITRIRSQLQLDKAYPVLLNVARLSAVKSQAELIQALPLILERFPNAKLLIAGDGPLMPELTNLRDRLNLQKQVLLLGNRDDVKALLHISDLFVFSSYYEGLPGAIIEAMAAGKPVVAFDIPSLKEVVIDGFSGVLVGERNIGRFSKAIIHLTEHPEIAREMGNRARQIVREKYDIRQNVESLEGVYQQMLGGSPVDLSL